MSFFYLTTEKNRPVSQYFEILRKACGAWSPFPRWSRSKQGRLSVMFIRRQGQRILPLKPLKIPDPVSSGSSVSSPPVFVHYIYPRIVACFLQSCIHLTISTASTYPSSLRPSLRSHYVNLSTPTAFPSSLPVPGPRFFLLPLCFASLAILILHQRSQFRPLHIGVFWGGLAVKRSEFNETQLFFSDFYDSRVLYRVIFLSC